MMSKRRTGRCLAMIAILAAAVLVAGPTIGQQRRQSEPAAEKQSETKKPRGRLPAYFAAVVSQKQRDEIYTIQAQYDEELATLRARIEELLAERDRAVDAVLDDEQLAEVNAKREAARKRREERSAARAEARRAAVEEDASSSN